MFVELLKIDGEKRTKIAINSDQVTHFYPSDLGGHIIELENRVCFRVEVDFDELLITFNKRAS